jgi:hypothetical protein
VNTLKKDWTPSDDREFWSKLEHGWTPLANNREGPMCAEPKPCVDSFGKRIPGAEEY